MVRIRNRSCDFLTFPRVIDTQYFQPLGIPRQPRTLIFAGEMSDHANVARVHALVRHCMPLIWKERPGVKLIIVGRTLPASVRGLAIDPRIDVTRYVDDVRPYIGRAQVAVSPVPYTAGNQMRILEAMAMGTPVVASSSTAAGLQAVAGQDLLLADTPEAFACAVLSLLDNRLLWCKLSERGQTYTAAYHDGESILTTSV